jgi:RimJ/RimL family protein N-acetyltransferase
MKIRRANVMDMAWLVEEGIKFLEFLYPHKDINHEDLYLTLDMLRLSGVVFIAEKDGKPIGSICGIVSTNLWFPKEKDLTELFWWVTPEHRGSSAALRLLKALQDYAKDEPSIQRLIMTRESVSPICEDVYTKRGFELKESNYVMEV